MVVIFISLNMHHVLQLIKSLNYRIPMRVILSIRMKRSHSVRGCDGDWQYYSVYVRGVGRGSW